MPTIFHCTNPTCGKKWNVPDHLLERFTSCKQCGSLLVKATMDGNGTSPSGRPAKGSKGLEHLGRFQVRAKLGAGAFGTVYRAFDPQLEREIALKVPQAGVLDSPKRVERFLREAKAAAQLRHPHIVPVYDAGQDDSQYFIASAFIKGNSLAEEIDEGGMDCRRAARIVQVLAEALAYAHSLDIVHRDIKPANIMVDEEDQPHVMDFGLAARTDSAEKLTQDGAVLGTPAYMAPEQAAGQKGDAKAASDQYSLGVVLYELLCGKTPFEGPPQIVLYNAIHTLPPPLRKLRKDVPRDLETICLKAMAKDVKDRFKDCQAMADDLRRWLEGEPITARRPAFFERVVRWVKREPKLALSGGFALLGLIAVAIALSIIASNLQAEVNQESAEKDKALKAKKDSDDALASEKDGHKKSLDDLNQKNLDLAQEKIDGNDLGGALIALEKCPKELRNWEWKYLILRAEGLPVQRVFIHPPRAKERWRGFPPLGFTADSRTLVANFWSQNSGIISPVSSDLDSGKAVEGMPGAKLFHGMPHAVSGDGKRLAVFQLPPQPIGKPLPVGPGKITIWEGKQSLNTFEVEPICQSLALNHDGSQVSIALMQKAKDGQAAEEPERVQVKIWDTQAGKELVPLEGSFDFVYRLAFSPDGKQLALASGNQRTTYKDVFTVQKKIVDGKEVEETVVKKVAENHLDAGTTVLVFDATSGKKKQEFKMESSVQALAFSPDSTRLLVGHQTGMVMWDTESGKEPVIFETRAGAVMAFAFSADGSRIASGSGFDSCARGALVKLWDTRTGRLVLILPAPNLDTINSLAFSGDGLHLAAGSNNSDSIVVWSVRPGLLDYYHDGHGGPVTSVAWSPDGESLTSHADCNQTSRLWQPAARKNLLQVPGLFNGGLGFSKDNRFVFTSSGGCLGGCFGLFGGGGQCYGAYGGYGGISEFRLWRRPSLQPVVPADKGSRFLAISPDAKLLAVLPPMPDAKGPILVEKLPQVKILDGPDGKELCTLAGLRDGARVVFSEDSRRLASLIMEPTTAFKDQWKEREEKSPDGTKRKVVYSEKVPVTVHGNVVKIWNARSGKLLLKVGLADIVALSADGTRLATCETRPMFSEPIILPPKKMPAKPATEVEEVSFNQDKQPPLPPPMGNPFIPQIKIWDVDSGKLLHTLRTVPMPPKDEKIPQKAGNPGEALPGVPTRMCFSPNGKTLVAVFSASKQKVVKTKTVYEIVYKEEGGKKIPTKLAKQIAYEEEIIAPSSVKAWRVLTGKELLTHLGAIGVLAFSPDGTKLASAQGTPPGYYGGTPAPVTPISEPPKVSAPVNSGDMRFVSAQEPLPKIQPPGPGPKEDAEPPLPPDIKIWDLGAGKEVFTLRNRGAATCMAFSQDGKRLASASGNFGPTMEPGMMEASSSDFVSMDEPVAFGHRSYGANAKRQAIITVWSMQNGKDTVHIHGHVGPVNCLAFRPDGRALASAGDDGTVKIWKMNQP